MPIPAFVALGLLVSLAHASDPYAPAASKTTAKSSTTTAKSTTPTTKASSTTVAANTAPAKPAVKKPKPKPVTPAVTEPHEAPAADAVVNPTEAPAAGTSNSEVMAEIVALRADVDALRKIVEEQAHPPPPPLSPEEQAKERARAAADERIISLQVQRNRLDEAVAGGLDHAIAAPSIERIDAELQEAQAARIAIDAPPPVEVAAKVEAPPEVSLAIDLGVGSAYAFRGLNVFAAKTMQDANGVFSPALTATFNESGITVGYWGAYQINGDNASALVDSGFGAESDLVFGWTHKVAENITVGAGATAYIYPFASADAAGVAAPIYVEPTGSIIVSEGLDLGLQVTAMYGVQEAVAVSRYVYVHPTIGRTVELPAGFSLIGAVGGGGKIYFAADAPTDNVWDASADLAVQKTIADAVYIRPSVHGVWTDLADKSVGESTFGWFGVNVGAAI